MKRYTSLQPLEFRRSCQSCLDPLYRDAFSEGQFLDAFPSLKSL
jgi:hypothetical protein